MIRVQNLLLHADAEDIEAYFSIAKQVRDELPITTKVLCSPFLIYM